MRGRRAGKVSIQPTQFIVSMQVEPTAVEGAQGGAAPFIIPVSRSGNLGFGGSVDWAVTPVGSNPAIEADFGGAFPSGTLTFTGYQMNAEITITIHGNDIAEGDRTFLVTLSNVSTDGGSGQAMIAIPAATCTIIDDEGVVGGGSGLYDGKPALYAGTQTKYGVDPNG